MKKRIVGVALLAGLLLAEAAAAEEKRITRKEFGCTDLDQYREIRRMRTIDKDAQGFTSALAAAVRRGQCFFLEPGVVVYEKDWKMAGYVQLREKGSSRQYWTIQEAVQ